MEDKLQQYDIKIIEYEDDINILTEDVTELQLKNNQLRTSNLKYKKRIKELNAIMYDLAAGGGELVLKAAQSIKESDLMRERVSKLQGDIHNKNLQLASLAVGSEANGVNVDSAKNYADDDSPQMIVSESTPQHRDEVPGDFTDSISLQDAVSSQQHQTVKDLNAQLTQKIQNQEIELEDLRNKNGIYMQQLNKMKSEIGLLEDQNVKMKEDARDTKGDENEDLDSIRDILLKFIRHVPIISPPNEQMLNIVYSMVNMDKEAINQITFARKEITPQGG